MARDKEEIIIQDRQGKTRGHFWVYNSDPRFHLPLHLDTDPWEIPIDRGDKLLRNYSTGPVDQRTVIGVTHDTTLVVGSNLEIIAPRAIEDPNPEKPYLKHQTVEGEGSFIELRPGTKILGGRRTGFYDNLGIIIEAEHTGGDFKKDEDWAYRVIGPSALTKLAPQWILLADVGWAVSSPASIMGFRLEPSKTIDDLLAAAERELFEYFIDHPEKLDSLSPKQFEQLVLAIYKNLGFATETIGAWNQADGGVDIVAVSKSQAETEFRIAIQCKTSKEKLSARPIRELAGVLDAFRAHQGIVATTSRFTTSARREIEGHLWRISLQDRDDLYKQIASILLPEL